MRTNTAGLPGQPQRLHPTARKIRAAARRLVISGGFKALSLKAVATASGTHKASIGYYFGNKAGLVAALADSVMRTPPEVSPLEEPDAYPSTDRYIGAYLKRLQDFARDPDNLTPFLELLPHLVREDDLRQIMASYYDEYRDMNADVLAAVNPDVDRETLRPWASLICAVIDGLSIQEALDPSGQDARAAYTAMAQLLALGPPASIDTDEPS